MGKHIFNKKDFKENETFRKNREIASLIENDINIIDEEISKRSLDKLLKKINKFSQEEKDKEDLFNFDNDYGYEIDNVNDYDDNPDDPGGILSHIRELENQDLDPEVIISEITEKYGEEGTQILSQLGYL